MPDWVQFARDPQRYRTSPWPDGPLGSGKSHSRPGLEMDGHDAVAPDVARQLRPSWKIRVVSLWLLLSLLGWFLLAALSVLTLQLVELTL